MTFLGVKESEIHLGEQSTYNTHIPHTHTHTHTPHTYNTQTHTHPKLDVQSWD
jgi:hypothetical protein